MKKYHFYISAISLLTCSGCFGLASGVIKDTQERGRLTLQACNELNFTGRIVNKKKFIVKDDSFHRASVKLDNSAPHPSAGEDYYFIDSESNLFAIKISEQIYNGILEGDKIGKFKNEDSLYVIKKDGSRFRYPWLSQFRNGK